MHRIALSQINVAATERRAPGADPLSGRSESSRALSEDQQPIRLSDPARQFFERAAAASPNEGIPVDSPALDARITRASLPAMSGDCSKQWKGVVPWGFILRAFLRARDCRSEENDAHIIARVSRKHRGDPQRVVAPCSVIRRIIEDKEYVRHRDPNPLFRAAERPQEFRPARASANANFSYPPPSWTE